MATEEEVQPEIAKPRQARLETYYGDQYLGKTIVAEMDTYWLLFFRAGNGNQMISPRAFVRSLSVSRSLAPFFFLVRLYPPVLLASKAFVEF